MHRNHVLTMLLVLTSLSAVRGQEQPRVRIRYPGSYLRDALPIADLPPNVDARDGQLTLYADFKGVTGDAIPIYLINRTDHRIGFSAQDWDPFLKLEALGGNGSWERAQTHYHSGCPSSYTPMPSLRQEEFFKTWGWYPLEGEPRTIRYRIFREFATLLEDGAPERTSRMWRDVERLPILLVSNAGPGRALPAAIEGTRTDGLAPSHGSFEIVRDLALGITKGDRFEFHDRRGIEPSHAVKQLGRFPTKECLSLVLELTNDPDRKLASAAMKALAKMGIKLAAAEEAFQRILMRDDAEFRVRALWALQTRPVTPEVIAFAKGFLHDNELQVRVAAMRVIAMRCHDDPEVKAYVNSMYNDPDPKIQAIFNKAIFPHCIDSPLERWGR